MALVQLTISALPAHVRTARLMATAVARRAGIAESALDEIRLAVGEACSRAVEAHRVHCPSRPIQLDLVDSGARGTDTPAGAPEERASHNGSAAQRFEVVVFDRAPATESAATFDDPHTGIDLDADTSPNGVSGLSPDVGLAVIAGLADEVSIEPHEDGTVVRMSWPFGKSDPDTGPDPVG
ncbi:ATP-binding protein [Streptomonospora salina]|uniref:Anti-sigma regulatory factor (Ser/Thr protein kinase) n=1 Tax=Streptomonospora salina TaxID=104205 RepID=A0A841ED88_9ACTN|nr:ATP-binding protein [Streptomonospora salina]MBB5998928.1 anti-sigma regulatory factor (Ser/Thr protein kinase) [Streptomonospora salina]